MKNGMCKNVQSTDPQSEPTVIPPGLSIFLCTNLSLSYVITLREEYRLRVSENMVLRRIFGPRSEKVTQELRKLHKEELHNLYSSPHIMQVICMGR